MFEINEIRMQILTQASKRDDRAILFPPHISSGADKAIARVLAAGGLVREITAAPGMPVWRQDEEDGRVFSLVVTDEGIEVIGGLGTDHPVA